MARRLSNVASKIMGRNDIVSYSVASSLRLQARMGLSISKHLIPNKPVSMLLPPKKNLLVIPQITIIFVYIIVNWKNSSWKGSDPH